MYQHIPRGPWPHDLPDPRVQRELQELNLRFVELVAAIAGQPDRRAPENAVLGLDAAVASRIARLRPARRVALARCPYSLHGISLEDSAFWADAARGGGAERYGPGRPTPEGALVTEVRDFLFLSLAWAWHLANVSPVAARWMLGASSSALECLATLPFGSLRHLANDSPGLLHARLCDQRRFWSDLVTATESGSRQARFAAVSLGLQLSAAAGMRRAPGQAPTVGRR